MQLSRSPSPVTGRSVPTPSSARAPRAPTPPAAVGVAATDRMQPSAAAQPAGPKTEFARINETWFGASSASMHRRFLAAPERWHAYHDTFRQSRASWGSVPADEMIALYRRSSGLQIGDFGCGEGMIGKALEGRHRVRSFDHVAANDDVVACDIAHVPLANATLDVAIFSLALMGENFTRYLEEAHRTLRLGGTLHVIEMSRRFEDRAGFLQGLEQKGFSIDAVEEMWKFTHIAARKISDAVTPGELRF